MCAAENEAVIYFKNLISECDFPISFAYIQLQIQNCSPNVQQLMNEKYAGDKLYDFFHQHSNVFLISKLGIVSLNNSSGAFSSISQNSINTGARFKMKNRNVGIEKKAAKYFENIMKSKYSGAVIHVSCLYGHIEQASVGIIDYLNDMYPGETFDLFFYRFPNKFHVSDNYNISLKNQEKPHKAKETTFSSVMNELLNIGLESLTKATLDSSPLEKDLESQAVEYFRGVLINRYSGPVPYEFLRGHLGQASCEIIDFMRDNYPASDFLTFFTNNQNVFLVDKLGNVSLREITNYTDVKDAIEYIKKIMIEKYQGSVHYSHLQGHVQQAPGHVKDFLNDCFSGKNFLVFLSDNYDVFNVNADGVITLKN